MTMYSPKKGILEVHGALYEVALENSEVQLLYSGVPLPSEPVYGFLTARRQNKA